MFVQRMPTYVQGDHLKKQAFAKWRCRKALKSLPPMESTATYCLKKKKLKKKNLKGQLSDSSTLSKQEENHIEVKEAGTQFHHEPHSWHGDLWLGGNWKPKTLSSPWGGKGLNPTEGIPIFKTYTRETSPLKTNWARICETHKTQAIWETSFKGLLRSNSFTQGPAQR